VTHPVAGNEQQGPAGSRSPYSPIVAAAASRLRRLFPAGRRPAMG